MKPKKISKSVPDTYNSVFDEIVLHWMVFFIGLLIHHKVSIRSLAEMLPSELYFPTDTLRLKSYFTATRDFTRLREVWKDSFP
jgi:hypothetical protein